MGAFNYLKSIDWLAPIRPLLDGIKWVSANVGKVNTPAASTSTARVNARTGAAYNDNRNISINVDAKNVRDPAKVADMTARQVGNMRYAQ